MHQYRPQRLLPAPLTFLGLGASEPRALYVTCAWVSHGPCIARCPNVQSRVAIGGYTKGGYTKPCHGGCTKPCPDAGVSKAKDGACGERNAAAAGLYLCGAEVMPVRLYLCGAEIMPVVGLCLWWGYTCAVLMFCLCGAEAMSVRW